MGLYLTDYPMGYDTMDRTSMTGVPSKSVDVLVRASDWERRGRDVHGPAEVPGRSILDHAMRVLDGGIATLRHHSVRRLAWRLGLAAPFVLSLVLAIILSPTTTGNANTSGAWLAVLSLVTALLMLSVRNGLLFLVGLFSLLVFPLLVGFGLGSAPAWAQSAVAIAFYYSWLASVVAGVTGLAGMLRSVSRARY